IDGSWKEDDARYGGGRQTLHKEPQNLTFKKTSVGVVKPVKKMKQKKKSPRTPLSIPGSTQIAVKELAEVDNLILETERLEMDENMLDIDNDDLLGDSPDLDAEKLEAISQLSPANVVIAIDAPSTHPPSKEKAVLSHQEPIPKSQQPPYVPKGLLKKKSPRSLDIKAQTIEETHDDEDDGAAPFTTTTTPAGPVCSIDASWHKDDKFFGGG
ncbi:hypothetical protein HID58_048540, partial [Brassica napus]